MSDDSKDSPPAKLTLSRDLKTKVSKSQADTRANPNTTKALPAMRLRRRSDIADTTDTANAGTESINTRIVPHTKPEPSPAAEPPQPAKAKFNPKNPFGGKTAKASPIQSNEIKDPDSPAATSPSPPPPHTRSQSPSPTKSAAHIEAVIHSLDKEKAPKTQRSSMLPSIIMILVLLLVLGGAGFGLWKVLLASNDMEDNSGSRTNSTVTALPAKPKPNTPIQKAKATIAKVPDTDLAAIVGNLPPTPNRNTAIPVSIQQNKPDVVVPKQPKQPKQQASNRLIEANKQAASNFLSNIHIGGVRTGERPIIILDGERYNVDDVVHVETDLKFHGLRDGRLAFRDRNGIVYLKSF